jgi:hypothetical protein
VLVQPAAGMRQQLLPVGTADDLVAQDADQRAPLVWCHPAEPEPPPGELLVIGQGAPAGVQRTQRRDVGYGDAELLAEVPQQHHGQHPEGVQRSPAHAHEPRCSALLFGSIHTVVNCTENKKTPTRWTTPYTTS